MCKIDEIKEAAARERKLVRDTIENMKNIFVKKIFIALINMSFECVSYVEE